MPKKMLFGGGIAGSAVVIQSIQVHANPQYIEKEVKIGIFGQKNNKWFGSTGISPNEPIGFGYTFFAVPSLEIAVLRSMINATAMNTH